MDYNKFEDRISSWIENDLSLKERKEFEAFLAENPQYVFLLFQLPGNAFSEDIITNSNSMSEKNIESIPVVNDSLDTEDKPDNSYDINGTFVGNDEQ